MSVGKSWSSLGSKLLLVALLSTEGLSGHEGSTLFANFPVLHTGEESFRSVSDSLHEKNTFTVPVIIYLPLITSTFREHICTLREMPDQI